MRALLLRRRVRAGRSEPPSGRSEDDAVAAAQLRFAWALAHSEADADVHRACEMLTACAYPSRLRCRCRLPLPLPLATS